MDHDGSRNREHPDSARGSVIQQRLFGLMHERTCATNSPAPCPLEYQQQYRRRLDTHPHTHTQNKNKMCVFVSQNFGTFFCSVLMTTMVNVTVLVWVTNGSICSMPPPPPSPPHPPPSDVPRTLQHQGCRVHGYAVRARVLVQSLWTA